MLRMLLPLDGSVTAEQALPHAVALADAFGGKITLLRVVPPAAYRSEGAFSQVDWRLQLHQALSYLENTARIWRRSDLPIDVVVDEGPPAETILEAVKSGGIQLLVMSAHGSGAAFAFPQGSVASKVLSRFGGSLLLLDTGSPSAHTGPVRYRRLLVPIDGSQRAECAMRIASLLALAQGAELSIACVDRLPSLPAILRHNYRAQSFQQELATLAHSEARRHLDGMCAKLPRDLRVNTSVVLSQDNRDAIAETIRSSQADLLVASSDLVREIFAPLPGTDREFSQGLPIPVLSLNTRCIGDAFSFGEAIQAGDITSDAMT